MTPGSYKVELVNMLNNIYMEMIFQTTSLVFTEKKQNSNKAHRSVPE